MIKCVPRSQVVCMIIFPSLFTSFLELITFFPTFGLNLQVFPLSWNSSRKCLPTQLYTWPNLSGNLPIQIFQKAFLLEHSCNVPCQSGKAALWARYAAAIPGFSWELSKSISSTFLPPFGKNNYPIFPWEKKWCTGGKICRPCRYERGFFSSPHT